MPRIKAQIIQKGFGHETHILYISGHVTMLVIRNGFDLTVSALKFLKSKYNKYFIQYLILHCIFIKEN